MNLYGRRGRSPYHLARLIISTGRLRRARLVDPFTIRRLLVLSSVDRALKNRSESLSSCWLSASDKNSSGLSFS